MQTMQQSRPNTRNGANGRNRRNGRKSGFAPKTQRVDPIERAHLQALLEERVGQVPGYEPHRAGYQRTLERINNGEERSYSVAESLNNAVVNCLLGHRILPYGMPGVRSLD